MIPRIYIDTSVIGGCYDEEFSYWSNLLFDEFKVGKKIAVISDLTIAELNRNENFISEKIKLIPVEFVENVMRNNNTEFLAKKYIENKALSQKYFEDAHHIAIATVNNVNILVSWNFKHKLIITGLKSIIR